MRYRIQPKIKVIEDLKDSFSKASLDRALSIIRGLNTEKLSFRDLVEGTKKPQKEKPTLFVSLKKGFSYLIANLIADGDIHRLDEFKALLNFDFIGDTSLHNFYKKIFENLYQERERLPDLGDYVCLALIEKSIFEEDRNLIIQSVIDKGGKESITEKILEYLMRTPISDSDINPLLATLNKNEILIYFFSALFRRIPESKPDEKQETLLKIGKAILDKSALFDSVQPLPAIFYVTKNSMLTKKANELLLKIEEKIGEEKVSVIGGEIEKIKQRIDELTKQIDEKKIEFWLKKEVQDHIENTKIRTNEEGDVRSEAT